MPRGTDPFWTYVKLLPNKNWNCNFCGNSYAGSATRIKAHLAGFRGYGINDCKDVDGQVRSEARKALKPGKGVAESSNGSEGNVEMGLHPMPAQSSDPDFWRDMVRALIPENEAPTINLPRELSNGAEGNIEEGPHQLVITSNEDGTREISFADMPYLNSNAMSTIVASSSNFLLHEMNVPSQYLPTQNMTTHGDFSFWTQPPQSHAGDSNIEPQNLSNPSSGGHLTPEALTNMPHPVNAEEGEPNTEVPQVILTELSNGAEGNVGEGLPVTVNDEDVGGDTAFDYSTFFDFTNTEASASMPHPWNAEEEEPNTEDPQDARTKDAVMVSQPGNCGLVYENAPSLKRKRGERSNREVVNNCRCCCFRKLSRTHATRLWKSSPFSTTELVGKESKKTINKICNYLMKDEIVIIGIYGMGGVGKTTILMHIHNRVLEDPTFNDVFWVTAPLKFSIYRLQSKIANAVGLDNLSMDKDVKRRACILNRHLKSKRAVLCLDGLWMHFDIEDVGIPVEKGSIKLVMTTRSLDVCEKMVCQKKVELGSLDLRYDCWVLFLKKLCFGRDLPSEVKRITSSILDKCGGLPLGIIEIATQMRGLKGVHEWKDLLQQLENSMMELGVFKKLKLSYMNLGNPQVQQCFLHLVLCFGEYSKAEIIRKVLIESFIDEGLLNGIATRQELHNKGNTILDKIKRACLGVDKDGEYLLVHPLIRDMALQIVTSTTHMVKANMRLKEIPKDKYWTDHLEKVFLQKNYIKKIPFGISPNCPKLTRLSLNDNVFLEAIHESFFRHLNGLKVLDLSKTKITELPDTISHLENLEALLLQECQKLHCIPCVRKLRSLKKLDLSGCAMLGEVPEGMKMLVELTYLDLLGTKIKTLPEGVLGKLVNLQYLVINYIMECEEEIELTMVEGFYCSVPDVETFNAYVRLVEQNSSQPYDLALSASGNYFFRDKHERRIIIESCHSIAATLDGEIGGDGRALLPKNVQVLGVGRCSGLTSLCELGPLNNLEELEIEEWEKLEELGAVHFPRLRGLNITRCTKLKHFLMEGHELRCLQWLKIEGSEELEGINIAAPFLYNIEVYKCPKMKWVVKWQWLATRFPNLKSIKIKNCRQLEEIVGGLPPIGATCHLTKIEVEGCNNMKRLLMTRDMMDEEVEVAIVEGLYCSVPNVETFNACVRLVEQNSSQPYDLALIASGNCFSRNKHERRRIIIESCHSITATVDREIGGDGRALLPKNVQVLEVRWCGGVTSLCEVGPLYNLEELKIEKWEKLEELGAVHFPRLRRLYISGCSKLKRLLKEGHELQYLQWLKIEGSEELEGIDIVAPSLYSIEVYGCPKMKRVVEWEWLETRLPNLRSIKIKHCEQLKEIIGERAGPTGATYCLAKIKIEGCKRLERVLMTWGLPLSVPFLRHLSVKDCKGIKEIISSAPATMHLNSNLTHLTLWKLPALEVIYDETVSWHSIECIDIRNCPTLKRLPKIDNGFPCPPRVVSNFWIDQQLSRSRLLEWRQSLFQPVLERLASIHEPREEEVSDQSIVKYIHRIATMVDKEIGGDGSNLPRKDVQVLTVGRGSGATSLSKLSSLKNLEELTTKDCEKLEELGAVHFLCLRVLKIERCSKLKHLSVKGDGFPHLLWFRIDGSEELERIDLAAPCLKLMEVFQCSKMKRVVEGAWLATHLPDLKSIIIQSCEKLEEIIGGPLPTKDTCLTKIEIDRCNNMKGVLLMHDVLPHLPSLQQITVKNCEGIEMIIGTAPDMMQPSFPKLTRLTLRNLPELKEICDRIDSCDHICDHIQLIEISRCPKLKRIPLPLRPRDNGLLSFLPCPGQILMDQETWQALDNGLLSPPCSLEQILIDQETWQALEWDHPLARISLEPFVKFISD